MTRYVGSRASGYPPDFVSFRRRAGALSAGAARRHRSLARSRPPSLSGERCSGMPRSRPGMPTGTGYPTMDRHRMTDSSADARDPPTRCNQGSPVPNRPAPNMRSIVGDRATHVCGFDKTAILFGDFDLIIQARRAWRGRALPRRARLSRRCRLNPCGRRSLARFSTGWTWWQNARRSRATICV